MGFAKVKWPWMAISVLISRDAHQNGLEAKPALRGKPVGPTRQGCVSLVTLLCTSKESNSPSEGEIKLAAYDAKSVNNTNRLDQGGNSNGTYLRRFNGYFPSSPKASAGDLVFYPGDSRQKHAGMTAT